MSGSHYSGPWVISGLIADRAERWPERVAAFADDGTLTNAEVVQRAARIARGLRRLGVSPGDRVATMLPSSAAYLSVWHGIVWAGAVDVPVNTELKGTFLVHVLRDSGARVLVTEGRWVERLRGSELPDLEHLVVVGPLTSEAPVAVTAIGELLAEDPAPVSAREEPDLAHILYTSGTTGASKGVMCSHRSFGWLLQGYIQRLGLGFDDVGYSMFPLFHQMGRAAMVGTCAWVGAPVVLRARFSAGGFWEDIRATGSTFFGYFGAVILFLWRQPPRPDDAYNPARVAFGASAPPELVEPWEERFGIHLAEVYGSTELGLVAISSPAERRRGTMGQPVGHLEIGVHDERDRPVAPGVKGEIVARPREPHAMFDGYWGAPEQTLAAFRNLWFHSGDSGSLDGDGYLTFSDRMGDAIRRRGQQISSFEVEEAVRGHPLIVECAAYPVPSEHGDHEVMIAVVVEPDAEFDASSFFDELIPVMPRFALPRYVRVMPSLPQTPTQRVQKYKLRAEGITTDTFDRELLGVTSGRE
ncbi:MAG TPA: AMP-binding protein [Solirubrobacteraceae bacterium]|nr:AMP-binding protein [Solirubrobacteraceae bacterium]